MTNTKIVCELIDRPIQRGFDRAQNLASKSNTADVD